MTKDINDNFIINEVFPIILDSMNRIIKSAYNNLPKEVLNYIENRYDDSESLKETLYRIKNNIEVRPTCKICGGKVLFDKTFYRRYCSRACVNRDPNKIKDVLEKQRKYNLEHYGVEHNMQRKECQKSRKNTFIERYGTYKLSELGHKEKLQKNIQKKIKQYGSKEEYYKIINNKKIETIKKKYNINSWSEFIALKDIQNKIYKTKKERHSFSTSYFQKFIYEIIKEFYPKAIEEYKDEKRYPWKCDIYIPEEDMFIECQGMYTHGGHPFNENDPKDIEKVNKWIEKKNFGAIDVWTISDPQKRETAKENNLKYFEFWHIEDFIKWLREIEIDKEVIYKKPEYKNIEKYLEIPKCPICGKDCKRRSGITFCKSCGDKECIRKIRSMSYKETNLKKYGVVNVLNLSENKKKAQEKRIEILKEKIKTEGIPKCPICGRDYKNIGIYNFLKTCGSETCKNKLIQLNKEKREH